MKRSKIFLGVTTSLLAVAGLAATRHAKFNNRTIWYITQAATGSGHFHVCANVAINCTHALVNINPLCTISVPKGTSTVKTTVYTQGSLSGGAYQAPSSTNCVSPAYQANDL